MRYARVLSNYFHRGLTKVRDAHGKHNLFDLVQPGQVFPCAYEYDERSEPILIATCERPGYIEMLPPGEIPAKDEIAPQYFDPDVLATLPPEFHEHMELNPKPVKAKPSNDNKERES